MGKKTIKDTEWVKEQISNGDVAKLGGKSLAEIENDSGWIEPDLLNDYVHYSDDDKCYYRKIGNIVFINGALKDGDSGDVAFNLPEEFRPLGRCVFINHDYDGDTCEIYSDGRVVFFGDNTDHRFINHMFFVA